VLDGFGLGVRRVSELLRGAANKMNNCATNLEWLTRRQNQKHAVLNGRGPKPKTSRAGSENGNARLSPEQVGEILALKHIVGQRSLAVLCGVSKSTIQFIHQGKHWSSGPEDLRVREYPKIG
jgi:hypothetical protein